MVEVARAKAEKMVSEDSEFKKYLLVQNELAKRKKKKYILSEEGGTKTDKIRRNFIFWMFLNYLQFQLCHSHNQE